jgi:hypothetical protein
MPVDLTEHQKFGGEKVADRSYHGAAALTVSSEGFALDALSGCCKLTLCITSVAY